MSSKKEKETQTEKDVIEYEQVTVKVPKQVMELLRASESLLEMSPQEWLEYELVDTVRSCVDSDMFVPEPKELADKFSLNPVFKAILDTQIS